MSDHCKGNCGSIAGSLASLGGSPPEPEPPAAESARLNPLAYFFGCISLAMIGYGCFHTVPVRTVDADELAEVLEFHPFEDISDLQLVIDSTFTGVIRRDGAIYSNYDRSAPPQKRACPT